MAKKLKGILLRKGEIDKDKFAEIVEIEDKLEDFYRILDCDIVDMPVRRIGGKYFTCICDDEGLLKDGNLPTMTNINYGEHFFGNIFLVHDGRNGNLKSVTDSDLDLVRKETVVAFSPRLDRRICVCRMSY